MAGDPGVAFISPPQPNGRANPTAARWNLAATSGPQDAALSRVREEWRRTGDSRNSVADGLAATAKVIPAAAAIMVFVFGSFILEQDRVVKLMGVGLATAILLDATVVRMLLVPATMELLGDRNWWLSRWLDRILPGIAVEGHADVEEQWQVRDDRLVEPAGRTKANAWHSNHGRVGLV